MQIKDMIIADWAIELRPLDALIVSRYRQAWRTGAEFPPVIIDRDTHEIISGNHRVSSALQEFGEDGEIPFVLQRFASRAAQLRTMAEENSKHGAPMDGFCRRKITCAMLSEGMTGQEIAELFNVPVKAVEKWGDQTVLVIGSGALPVKRGIDTERVTKMKKADYAIHSKRDLGVSAAHMIGQITRWLQNGWIDKEALKVELDSLKELL